MRGCVRAGGQASECAHEHARPLFSFPLAFGVGVQAFVKVLSAHFKDKYPERRQADNMRVIGQVCMCTCWCVRARALCMRALCMRACTFESALSHSLAVRYGSSYRPTSVRNLQSIRISCPCQRNMSPS